MEKIFIIEDDEKLRNELRDFLCRNGYEAECLEEFGHTKDAIQNSGADLVLLDIGLPVEDGQYICKEVRKESDIPIIMVTSKNTDLDELLSMNYGADDFVAKPFNTQILLARIAAILKRVNKGSQAVESISCGSFVLDTARGVVRVQENEVELTKNELKILNYLAVRRGMIVSRDALITYLWDSEMFVDDNTLTVNITRIRNKLERIGVCGVIQTKRGQGYLLL